MLENLFPQLFTFLKIIAWIVDIGFTGCILFSIWGMFDDGKTTGAVVTLMAGVLTALMLAANGAHILIVLFLAPMATWWVGCFFERSWRADDDAPSSCSNSEHEEETWGEFALKHTANIMIARAIDREINQAVEDAKNGNDRSGNMHI